MPWPFRRRKDLPADVSATPPRIDFPRGVQCLHDPPLATMDIVFIHGQTGDRLRTWTASGEARPWPVTLLSPRFPNARILTFGYDASLMSSSDFIKLLEPGGTTVLAYNFLVSLGSYREADDTNGRPIVFICHSFGGVVCKKALVTAKNSVERHFQSLLDQTRGIIFLGTPTTWYGLNTWALQTMFSAGIPLAFRNVPVSVVKSNLERIAMSFVEEDKFHAMNISRTENGNQPIEVACFYEELPVPKFGTKVSSQGDTLPGCTPIGIRATHSDMCKFRNDEDHGFTLICAHLSLWTKGIDRVQEHLKSAQPSQSVDGTTKPDLRDSERRRIKDTMDEPNIIPGDGAPIRANTKGGNLDPIETKPPATRLGFEIAVICALTIEADAVEALFDNSWSFEDLYKKAPGDPNAYSTGSIGRHNVVLVHMSDMGKANAAAAAASCRNSFPNIKLALVVGVCGAMPNSPQTNEDIFLGDIILSRGVIQYDFGRQLPEHFKRKDTYLESLGRPNAELRALLSKLQGIRSQDMLRDRMVTHLGKLQGTPRLQATYPGTKSDQVFHSRYRHISDGQTCEECRCDTSFVSRYRSSVETVPGIHFGLIASGDTVMKSGEARDEIAKRDNVIGFEMEGAGLWDVFPCVIVKGVCDYADSHKVKVWQRYAVATAAACAKAFLEYWVSSSVE